MYTTIFHYWSIRNLSPKLLPNAFGGNKIYFKPSIYGCLGMSQLYSTMRHRVTQLLCHETCHRHQRQSLSSSRLEIIQHEVRWVLHKSCVKIHNIYAVPVNSQCQACGALSRNSLLKPMARRSAISSRPSSYKSVWRTTTLREISVSLEPSSMWSITAILFRSGCWHLTRLPNVPRPRMSICILADAADIDRAKQIELEYMSVDDLKKWVCYPVVPSSDLFPDVVFRQVEQKQEARQEARQKIRRLPCFRNPDQADSSSPRPRSLQRYVLLLCRLRFTSLTGDLLLQLESSLPPYPMRRTSATKSPRCALPSSSSSRRFYAWVSPLATSKWMTTRFSEMWCWVRILKWLLLLVSSLTWFVFFRH